MSAFGGALLCGGRSSRMGRDKAFLEVDRQPLWRLQLAKLRAVCGEVVVCGSTSQRWFFEPEGVRFEADAAADLGPLSGIARALESVQATHVLVLAVDMPKMSERYLCRLREAAGPSYGVVPERAGAFEGLCAVYPANMYPLVLEQLSGSDRSLQALVRSGVERNLLRPFSLADSELGLFENWNTPSDLTSQLNDTGA
jgi:molybdopterin-guanine dinucleotide biosynthesis protein A